jgi:hypothetical protein
MVITQSSGDDLWSEGNLSESVLSSWSITQWIVLVLVSVLLVVINSQ